MLSCKVCVDLPRKNPGAPIILGFESCSKDEMYSETISNSPVLDKIPMAFNSNKPTYDNGLSRSFDDTENQWYIGDTLYVELQPEYGKWVLGRATLSPVNNQWEIEFSKQYASLTIPESGNCRVWYLKGAYQQWEGLSPYMFSRYIDEPYTAIYVDKNARYNYQNNKFTLIAELKPLTSRLRFTSPTESEIKVKGIESVRHVQYYDKSSSSLAPDYDGIYSVKRATQPLTIAIDKRDDNGMYTSEYVYGLLTNEYDSFSMINLADPEKVYFLQKSLFQSFSGAGNTGKISIPDRNNHEGWEMKDNFIQTLANEIDLSGSYAKQSFSLGQVTGYGIRCDVDLSKDHAWFKILSEDTDQYDGYGMWSSYDACDDVAFKGTLSLDIPFKKNYSDNHTITFKHYYSPHGTREKFTNIKLYYFSY